MLHKKYPIIAIFVLMVFSMSFGQNDSDFYTSRLQSGNPLLVQDAQYFILGRCYGNPSLRKSYATKLIKIIDQDDNTSDTVLDHERAAGHAPKGIQGQNIREQMTLSDAKTAAILLVGSLKINEALPVLVKHLNYMTPGHFSVELHLNKPEIEYFPCAIAIGMIGDTTIIPSLLEVVKNHPDKETGVLAGKTIQMIQGNLKPIEEALKTSTDSMEQQHLKYVLERITNREINLDSLRQK